ncbi:MAG: hypothetical protein Q9211_000601 [Gyalolechia sp. 1 TL-2023]
MDRVQDEKKPPNHDDTFNTIFPSLHNVSEDSGPRNYVDAPSPIRLKADTSSDEALKHIRTANNISISPELFEKLYLTPQKAVKGDLRNTFANPTPRLPRSPNADVAAGGFWFTLGSTLTPFYNAYGAYASDPTKPYEGLASEGFHASYGFFLLFMGFLSLLYLICALRTNIVFVTIFFGLFMTFVILTGSYWEIALDQASVAAKLQIASGAFAFLACLAGWWIFFAQMLASVDFPYQMPVGDISHLIRSGTERAQDKERFSA